MSLSNKLRETARWFRHTARNEPEPECKASHIECAVDCEEAADEIESADARIAELERECSQWRDELRIYRETENKRIAELEQAVTVRDTEIARLETDLELARRDGERWRKLRAMNWTQKDALAVVHVRSLKLGTETFTHDRLDLAIDARAGNGGGV